MELQTRHLKVFDIKRHKDKQRTDERTIQVKL